MKKFILAALAALILVGCGLNDSIVKAGKDLSVRVSQTDKKVTRLEKEFKDSQLAKDFATYVASENLKENFVKAKVSMTDAKTRLKSLKKIIDKDDSDDEASAYAKIRVINSSLTKAAVSATTPMKRLTELKATLDNSKKITKEAEKNNSYIVTKSADIVKFIEDQLISNENTSGKKDDLNKEIKLANDKVETSKALLLTITNEKAKGNSMDIAVFLAASNKLKKIVKDSDAQDKRVGKKIEEVNSSYTKILSDMREDLYITVGSTSWDNYYDSPTEHTTKQAPSKVTKAIYDRLSNNNGVIATLSSGMFSGLKLKISSSDWNALRVDKNRLLARGDDASEVWIADAPIKFFHKYIIVKNGVKKETDWIEVSEATYEKNFNNLNMSIVSKPYGSYESDAIKEATPAGMAFVGNKKYGEWREDNNNSSSNNGNSFWHYYGIYSFLSGGNNNHYYRNDYNHYNSYRSSSTGRGYYGRNNSYGTYGTRGIKRSRPSSARTRMKSSGSTRGSRSVRSAGRGSRGRGPGGGGK